MGSPQLEAVRGEPWSYNTELHLFRGEISPPWATQLGWFDPIPQNFNKFAGCSDPCKCLSLSMRIFHHSQGVLKGSCNACRKTSTIQPLCQVRFAPIPLAALRNKMELKATEATWHLQTSITWWVACFWKPQNNLFQSRNESNSSVLIFSAKHAMQTFIHVFPKVTKISWRLAF